MATSALLVSLHIFPENRYPGPVRASQSEFQATGRGKNPKLGVWGEGGRMRTELGVAEMTGISLCRPKAPKYQLECQGILSL